MLIFILLLLNVGINAGPAILIDNVDVIEVNTYSHNPTSSFEQVIFYRWNSQLRIHQVVDFRILIGREEMYPVYTDGKYLCRWSEEGVLREVYGKSMRITEYKFDPEVKERDILPQENRVLLKVPPRNE